MCSLESSRCLLRACQEIKGGMGTKKKVNPREEKNGAQRNGTADDQVTNRLLPSEPEPPEQFREHALVVQKRLRMHNPWFVVTTGFVHVIHFFLRLQNPAVALRQTRHLFLSRVHLFDFQRFIVVVVVVRKSIPRTVTLLPVRPVLVSEQPPEGLFPRSSLLDLFRFQITQRV
jgi:hypothetical protein